MSLGSPLYPELLHVITFLQNILRSSERSKKIMLKIMSEIIDVLVSVRNH